MTAFEAVTFASVHAEIGAVEFALRIGVWHSRQSTPASVIAIGVGVAQKARAVPIH